MTLRSIVDECVKKSADPRFPGLGKDPKVGFAMGVLLGAVGVGLYLRSVRDGVLSFATCWLLGCLWDSWITYLICWVLCGCWVKMRIRASTECYEASRRKSSGGTAPHDASGEPDVSAPPRGSATPSGV